MRCPAALVSASFLLWALVLVFCAMYLPPISEALSGLVLNTQPDGEVY